MESVEGCVDPDGSTDYGNIDEFSKIPGGFHLAGNFGSVEVFGSHAYWRVHT
ncbi:hypothetical protein Q4601_20125 [Shewanella sp. 1_MG-2023]|uniref:hypothetical protein n=1 Tax=unclassified Shewanella TaxID=196818 RepID=UPI0026E31515|nr:MULTISPECIES: hypothetical protein [unclassified Shewanella]MDO6612094.1 hypothetical protein [Shewanella sp. 7_MG-2023]MDO6771830.1 hypothetical protein [Shewanella sp. 2_MG-2023]MDO6796604.1 hypothetical protein [Shewanella sp. 1_MG-2023]